MKRLFNFLSGAAILILSFPASAQTVFSLSTTESSLSPVPFPAINRHCCGDDWSEIETSRGTYTWTAFDNWQTQTAGHSGSKNMYTFRSVPTWASGSTTAAPPTDVTTSATCQAPLATTTQKDCMFSEFVVSMMQHLCGVSSPPGSPLTGVCNMGYVNLWNEFNAGGYWTGTAAQLAQMSLDAAYYVRLYCGDCYIVAASASAGGVGGGGSVSGDYDVALLAYLTAWGGLSGFVAPDYIDYHAYPSRDNVAPVPWPTTLVQNSGSTCTSGNTPNSSCYVSVFQETNRVKGSAVLNNSAISSWASTIPVMTTEGGWGTLIGVCNGATCTPTDSNVIALRKAYISEWMLGLWQQGTVDALWYEYGNDACWGILDGPGNNGACSGNPTLPSGALPWLTAFTQTQSWIAGCTSPGSWTTTAVTGGNTWLLNATCSGHAAQFAFFDGWLTNYSMSTSFSTQQNLAGSTSSTGGTVTLTQQPVLLTSPTTAPSVLATPILMGKINVMTGGVAR